MIKDPKKLRRRLRDGFQRILDVTKDFDGPMYGDRGSPAADRRWVDDFGRGRFALKRARQTSHIGRYLLNQSEDLDAPLQSYLSATSDLIWGVEQALSRGSYRAAGLRGRRPDPEQTATTAERNRRLADAYEEQVEAGKPRGRAAMMAARESDPLLRREFDGWDYEALKDAKKRGRRKQGSEI